MAEIRVIPCVTKGEVGSALDRITDHLAGAVWEARSILSAAVEGIATPDQILRASELRAEALSLAGHLSAICAAVPASRPVIPQNKAA